MNAEMDQTIKSRYDREAVRRMSGDGMRSESVERRAEGWGEGSSKSSESPIAVAMQGLVAQVHRAEKLGEIYTNALAPVLGPEVPMPCDATTKDAGYRQSPLVEGIAEVTARLNRTLDGFEQLLSRVQL